MWIFGNPKSIPAETLHQAFDRQAARLRELEYAPLLSMTPETFDRELAALWERIEMALANALVDSQSRIPLLIIANGNTQPMMEKIGAHTSLDLSLVKEMRQRHPGFHALLGVDDGAMQVAKSPQESLRQFEKRRRQPLNLTESIALLTHYPDTLNRQYVTLGGSRYPKDGQDLPLLWLLDGDKHPELHYAWIDIAHGSYGMASYEKLVAGS